MSAEPSTSNDKFVEETDLEKLKTMLDDQNFVEQFTDIGEYSNNYLHCSGYKYELQSTITEHNQTVKIWKCVEISCETKAKSVEYEEDEIFVNLSTEHNHQSDQEYIPIVPEFEYNDNDYDDYDVESQDEPPSPTTENSTQYEDAYDNDYDGYDVELQDEPPPPAENSDCNLQFVSDE